MIFQFNLSIPVNSKVKVKDWVIWTGWGADYTQDKPTANQK